MEATGTDIQNALSLISPFPAGSVGDAYTWHLHTPTAVSGATYTREGFTRLLWESAQAPGARSWGIMVGEQVQGLVMFEPVWRVGQLVDGVIHIALSRAVWGRRVLESVADDILPELFTSIPSLQRLTSYTPEGYTPGLAVAGRLGFTREGVLRDSVEIAGRLRSLVVCGLTRRDYGSLRRSNN